MDKQQQMEVLIEQYKQSGISIKEFCKQKQVSYHTFQYWRYRKKREEQSQAAFTPILANTPHFSGRVVISYPNGVSVSLDAFDPNQILQLLRLGNV